MKLVRAAALAAALVAVVAFAGIGRPDFASGDDGTSQVTRSITVSGVGSVKVVPDRAGLSFGVTTQGKTAGEALDANGSDMRKVIAALTSAGIAAADIQTASVSLFPRTSDDGNTIVGYTASNTVSTTIRDIDSAGAVIDAAVAAGANQVSGPTLTRSGESALYLQALKAAVADARAKATTLAESGGVQLGSVVEIVESGGGSPPVLAAKAALADSGTPIQPGTETIDASVTVEFSIS